MKYKKVVCLLLIAVSSITLLGCPTATAPVAQTFTRALLRDSVIDYLQYIFGSSITQQVEQINQDIRRQTSNSTAVQGLSNFDGVMPSIDGISNYLGQNIIEDTPTFNMDAESITLECYESESDKECISRHETYVKESLHEPLQAYKAEIDKIHEYNKEILDTSHKRLEEFDQTYVTCHDNINTNPNISLDDHVAVFENLLDCLLDSGFESELRALATESTYFMDKINEVKNY